MKIDIEIGYQSSTESPSEPGRDKYRLNLVDINLAHRNLQQNLRDKLVCHDNFRSIYLIEGCAVEDQWGQGEGYLLRIIAEDQDSVKKALEAIGLNINF